MEPKDIEKFNRDLLAFLEASPTPFHAVAFLADHLERRGFVRLPETERWNLAPRRRYLVIRDGAGLIAFFTGDMNFEKTGIHMAGAHTDSPSLVLKPIPAGSRHGVYQLGVEVYGGALLNPWFDRDLGIAGRVVVRDGEGAMHAVLVDTKRAVALIPSLAIHLDREVNKNRSVNAQTDLPPILLTLEENEQPDFGSQIAEWVGQTRPDLADAAILSHDLRLYDIQPPALVGTRGDFLVGGRLDNLLSCFAAIRALTGEVPGPRPGPEDGPPRLVVLNDHEEVGSASASGAQGPFLESVMERLCPLPEQRVRALARSFLVSADAAHGLHPNFSAKHDPQHGPLLNRGPVVKHNASRRYATDDVSAAVFQRVCDEAGVPVQRFVMRADMACGSTIGPLAATRLGLRAVDVGVPLWAMHSIRETAGAKDTLSLAKSLGRFFEMNFNIPI